MLITILLWTIRFLYEIYRLDGAIVQAYHALPSLYIRQMWIPGSLSGLLWSAGNFMCIIAVTFLGQGVGYSFTQASVSVSAFFLLTNASYKSSRNMLYLSVGDLHYFFTLQPQTPWSRCLLAVFGVFSTFMRLEKI